METIHFIGLFILALALLRVPIIGRYLSVINTLVHEIGHALMALITGGRVEKIELFSNTEGTAWTSSRNWFGRFLTSIAGYPFASFVPFSFLYLMTLEKDVQFTLNLYVTTVPINFVGMDIVLYTMIFFLLVSLILWVRNLYGFFWMLSFIALFFFLIRADMPLLTDSIVLFITFILVIKSTTSAWDIVNLSFKRTHDAGDATSLHRATHIIPTQVWGIFFFVQAVVFCGLSLLQLFI